MSKQKDNVSSLLAAIQRQPITPAEPRAKPQPLPPKAAPESDVAKPVVKTKPVPTTTKSKIGQPVQFWLHDDDRQTIRELAAWLAGQGLRTSDSQVIRAVLRIAKTGGALLEAYKEAASQDGRRKS